MTTNLTAVIDNDDFTDSVTDIPYYCRILRPDVWMVQEGKETRYRTELDANWGIRQRRDTEGTQGVAVGWNKDTLKAIGSAVDQPGRVGHGWQFIVDGPGLLPRGVVWQDLRVRGRSILGDEFRVASYHRPPGRYDHLWPAADRRLRAWLEASPLPVLLGMDSNEDNGPGALISHRWRWYGQGIDGVLTDLPVTGVVTLPRRRSDHLALAAGFRVPGKRSGGVR